MKALILVAAATLAACSKPAPVDHSAETKAWFIQEEMKAGKTREQAEDLFRQVKAVSHSPETTYLAQQRQKEIQKVNDQACEQAPYLDGC